jgi:hypothetical protein
VKNSNDDLKKLAKDGIKPSYTASQYSGWSSSLAEAFNDCGTNFVTVSDIIDKMKNDADVLTLINIYGTRSYGSCLLAGEWDDKEYSLPKAMESELSSGQKQEINQKLSKKGIKYQF